MRYHLRSLVPRHREAQKLQDLRDPSKVSYTIPDSSFLAHLSPIEEINSLISTTGQVHSRLFYPKKDDFRQHYGSRNSIAIRLPGESLIQTLLKEFNAPLLSSSVNLSGESAAQNSKDLNKEFKDQLDFCIEPEASSKSLASTIVNGLTSPPQILRQGELKLRSSMTSQGKDCV